MCKRYRCFIGLFLLACLVLTGTAVSAPSIGDITGKVTWHKDGSAIAGLWVTLHRTSDGVQVATGKTDSNGNYTVTWLSGKYFIKAGGLDGAWVEYLDEWYNEAETQADADTVVVLPNFGHTTNINFTLAKSAKIEGHVWKEFDNDGVYERDQEEAIPGDTVTISSVGWEKVFVTFVGGEFEFEDLKEGTAYTITLKDTAVANGRPLHGPNPISWTPTEGEQKTGDDVGFAIIYPLPNKSTISVAVIDDENGNGLWDANEPGLRAVEVWQKGSTINGYDGEKLVGENGMTSFPKIMSQECLVGVNELTLPAGYVSTNGGPVRKATPAFADEVTVVFLYSKNPKGDGGQSQDPYGAAAISALPSEFSLSQNYPNPFNPVTNIHYDLIEACHVTLTVFDVTGQIANTLVDGFRSAGHYSVAFNAGQLPTGIYYYKLVAGSFTGIKKMVYMK
jgi:hypothetical protein